MYKKIQYINVLKYFALITFLIHQVIQSVKVGLHWDDIGTIWAAGKFIEKFIVTLTDFNNPILQEYVGEEFYGVFASLPVHLLTRIVIGFQKISELFIQTPYFENVFDFYFFLRHIFLTLYVVMALLIISRKLQKMIPGTFSLWFIVFICFYPSFNGHALFNMTDLPLALNVFLATLYYVDFFILKKEKFDNKTLFLLSFLLASCILIRATSAIFLLPLLFFVIFENKNKSINIYIWKNNFKILICTFVFYFAGTPAMWRNPILYLNNVLTFQYDNPWRGVTLTNGNFIDAADPTFSYLSIWFFYKTPLVFILFFLVNLIFFKKTNSNLLNKYSYFIIIYTFALHAIIGPLTYNGIRHYLFLIPFFTCIFVFGFTEVYEKFDKYKPVIIFATFAYLCVTQMPYDQYKYTYFNEFASTNNMANYCEDINGCGDWLVDYWGTSGKESAEMLDKYDFEHLYVCSPQFSTTIYMNHNEINIDKFWVFKNGVPVYNETSGFQQFKLIYSEGHFKNALYVQNIREMYVHSIYLPHKPMDTCNFFEVENEFEISCSLVDKVSRKIRGSDVSYAFLSKCLFNKI